MKTVEEFIAEVERRYRCVDGLWSNCCQTGDEYVNLGEPMASKELPASPPGTCPDGHGRELAFDLETAVMSALICFETYATWWRAGHPGTVPVLYWRYQPKAFLQDNKRPGLKGYRCYVRTRLVLSAKPAIYRDIDALKEAMPEPPIKHPWLEQHFGEIDDLLRTKYEETKT